MLNGNMEKHSQNYLLEVAASNQCAKNFVVRTPTSFLHLRNVCENKSQFVLLGVLITAWGQSSLTHLRYCVNKPMKFRIIKCTMLLKSIMSLHFPLSLIFPRNICEPYLALCATCYLFPTSDPRLEVLYDSVTCMKIWSEINACLSIACSFLGK